MIGRWAIRFRPATPGRLGGEAGKAHIVESEVADRLVMKCGRELQLETRRGRFQAFVARRLDDLYPGSGILEGSCLQCRGEG